MTKKKKKKRTESHWRGWEGRQEENIITGNVKKQPLRNFDEVKRTPNIGKERKGRGGKRASQKRKKIKWAVCVSVWPENGREACTSTKPGLEAPLLWPLQRPASVALCRWWDLCPCLGAADAWSACSPNYRTQGRHRELDGKFPFRQHNLGIKNNIGSICLPAKEKSS